MKGDDVIYYNNNNTTLHSRHSLQLNLNASVMGTALLYINATSNIAIPQRNQHNGTIEGMDKEKVKSMRITYKSTVHEAS